MNLRVPVAQISRLEFPPLQVPDSHNLIIARNDVQSLVAPFSVLALNVQDQPLDRPLDPDTDSVTVRMRASSVRCRNVKLERDFLRRRERKIFERLGPRFI